MIPPQKHLAYALGYLDLGLIAEARAELSALSDEALATPAALALRMEIAMSGSNWEDVLPLAEALIALDAKQERPWVAWAYALRELQRTQEAQEVLLAGSRMISSPTILVSYNLACYACLLGELDEAQSLLDEVFTHDKTWRKMAKEDPDLAALFPKKKKA